MVTSTQGTHNHSSCMACATAGKYTIVLHEIKLNKYTIIHFHKQFPRQKHPIPLVGYCLIVLCDAKESRTNTQWFTLINSLVYINPTSHWWVTIIFSFTFD